MSKKPAPKKAAPKEAAVKKSTAKTADESGSPKPETVDLVSGDLDQARAILEGRYAAQEMFQFIQARMANFQKNLPEDYEMGVKLANYGVAAEIHIRGMGFQNPSIIEFYGMLEGGKQAILVQHVAQLNFMLLAVPPLDDARPYRVGFDPGISGSENPDP